MMRSLKTALLAASAAIALALASPALADAPGANTTAPGAVNVSVNGNNGNVTIHTLAPYVQDTLNLAAPGAFSVDQTNRFTSVGQWTGDGNDIDRVAAFSGSGTISASSSYQSMDPYSVGASNLDASVSATANGGLQQNLTFDQNEAGVYTQSQWSKQRTMELSAGGVFLLSASTTGASIAPSLGAMPSGALPAYSFGVSASAATGAADLQFLPTLATTGYQGLANNSDHGQYTGVNTNFQLTYSDSPVVNVDGHTVVSGAITVNEQPGAVFGNGTIH